MTIFILIVYLMVGIGITIAGYSHMAKEDPSFLDKKDKPARIIFVLVLILVWPGLIAYALTEDSLEEERKK